MNDPKQIQLKISFPDFKIFLKDNCLFPFFIININNINFFLFELTNKRKLFVSLYKIYIMHTYILSLNITSPVKSSSLLISLFSFYLFSFVLVLKITMHVCMHNTIFIPLSISLYPLSSCPSFPSILFSSIKISAGNTITAYYHTISFSTKYQPSIKTTIPLKPNQEVADLQKSKHEI